MGPIVKYCKATMFYDQDYLALYFSNDDSSYWKRGSFIKRPTSNTSIDNEWQQVTRSDNEWHSEWQRMTRSDKEWQRMVQRVTRNDNEWQRMTTSGTTSGTTSDNEWQRMTMSGDFGQFSFFFERNLLIGTLKWTLYTLRKTLKRNYWIKSRLRKTSSLEEILTVRSKYWDSIFFVCDTNNFKNL